MDSYGLSLIWAGWLTGWLRASGPPAPPCMGLGLLPHLGSPFLATVSADARDFKLRSLENRSLDNRGQARKAWIAGFQEARIQAVEVSQHARRSEMSADYMGF